MKCIIAGSRDILDYPTVKDAVEACEWVDEITEVVCGGAYGVDISGKWWAEFRKIPVKMFEVTPAEWKRLGKAAGPIRNKAMAEYADALILIWNGKSPGSANMLKHAQERGLRIYQHIVTD